MKELVKYGLPWIVVVIVPIFIANSLDVRLGAPGVGILTCIAAAYYFNLDNPHPNFKIHAILALFIWVLSIHVSEELRLGSLLPALTSATACLCLFLTI